jgi:hypothetical protein
LMSVAIIFTVMKSRIFESELRTFVTHFIRAALISIDPNRSFKG